MRGSLPAERAATHSTGLIAKELGEAEIIADGRPHLEAPCLKEPWRFLAGKHDLALFDLQGIEEMQLAVDASQLPIRVDDHQAVEDP